jgi:hypothetical protein
MKALHPDVVQIADRPDVDAGDITFAYTQLRDPQRRAEHDLRLFGQAVPVRPPRNRALRTNSPSRSTHEEKRRQRQRHWSGRTGRRLARIRAASAIAAFAVSAVGLAIASRLPQLEARPTASAAWPAIEENSAAPKPRSIDPAIRSASAGEFQSVMTLEGPVGTRLYSRQCLLQLSYRPTLFMLDHCVAFDRVAADWEQGPVGSGKPEQKHFQPEQRLARYIAAARGLQAGPVREAMIAEAKLLDGMR